MPPVEVSTTRGSGWIDDPQKIVLLTHLLPQVVLTSYYVVSFP